jgi:hypothetical protein
MRGLKAGVNSRSAVVVEAPIHSRSDVGWVIPIARRMSNRGGSTQAVLVVAISIDSIRDLINPDDLPVGFLVRIVTEDEIQIAFSSGSTPNGPDLNRMGNVPRQFRLRKEANY